jgi:hypothetical protein
LAADYPFLSMGFLPYLSFSLSQNKLSFILWYPVAFRKGSGQISYKSFFRLNSIWLEPFLKATFYSFRKFQQFECVA